MRVHRHRPILLASGSGGLHLNNDGRLHLAGSHHALLLLVRHRLQHHGVWLLEAPALEDPGGGEERTDGGKEASHGQSGDGARFRVAAVKPRVSDAKAFAPEVGFFAESAAVADVQIVVLSVRGVEPAIRGKLSKRLLLKVILPVGVVVRVRVARVALLAAGGSRARAVVERVPTPASCTSRAYLLLKALVRVVIIVVRSCTVFALIAIAVGGACCTGIGSVNGIKGGERGAASAGVTFLNGAVGSSITLVVVHAILLAIAPRLSLAVAVGPRAFLFAVRAGAAVVVGFAVITAARQTTARISSSAIRVRLDSSLGEHVAEFLSRVRFDVLLCAHNFSVRWRDHPLRGERHECDQRERARAASGHIDVVSLFFCSRGAERVCVRACVRLSSRADDACRPSANRVPINITRVQILRLFHMLKNLGS